MQHKTKVSAKFSSYSAGRLRKDHIEREIKKNQLKPDIICEKDSK